jgi:hypothetical protein
MIPLRRRGWHQPAQGQSFELSGNLSARTKSKSDSASSGYLSPSAASSLTTRSDYRPPRRMAPVSRSCRRFYAQPKLGRIAQLGEVTLLPEVSSQGSTYLLHGSTLVPRVLQLRSKVTFSCQARRGSTRVPARLCGESGS